jgi:tetratricopeptide (TPR) repeat protein
MCPGPDDASGDRSKDARPGGPLREAAMRAWDAGDAAAAEPLLLEELASAEREASGTDPSDPASQRLTQALADLGCFYAAHGSPAVADRLLVRALRLVEACPARGRTPAGVQLCTRLSELRCRPRGYPQAEALARRAVAVARSHPAMGPAHPDTARALIALGHSLDGQKKFDEAGACLDEALAVCKRAGAMPARTMWLLFTDLADLARDRGRHREALDLYRASLVLREQSLKDDHPELLAGLNDLAAAHERLGGRKDALTIYDRVLSELDCGGEGDDLRVAEAIHRVARTCAAEDTDRARALLERVLAIEERRLGPDHHALERTLRGLAAIADRQERPRTAVRLRERVLALRARRVGEDDGQLIQPVTELCHSHCLAGEWDRAEDLDRRALYLAEKHRGFEHATVARIVQHYSDVLRHLGKHDRAVQLAARAALIRTRLSHPGHDRPPDRPRPNP